MVAAAGAEDLVAVVDWVGDWAVDSADSGARPVQDRTVQRIRVSKFDRVISVG
jgi:hypothetical protein